MAVNMAAPEPHTAAHAGLHSARFVVGSDQGPPPVGGVGLLPFLALFLLASIPIAVVSPSIVPTLFLITPIIIRHTILFLGCKQNQFSKEAVLQHHYNCYCMVIRHSVPLLTPSMLQ